jgi:hypothetical protein
MTTPSAQDEGLIDRVKGVGGIILGVSENRNWIELFYEGDLMHTKKLDLPSGALFDVFVEEILHKTTVYEHPRVMIFFEGPCTLEISREGGRIFVRGCAEDAAV